MVSTESGAQHPVTRLDVGGDQDTGDREAVADPLGDRYDVGRNAGMLESEVFPGTPAAGLHLIEDEFGPCRVALPLEGLEKFVGGNPHTAYPLNAFDDYRANVALSQLFPNGLDVVQGDKGALLDVVYRSDDLGIVRYGHSFRRP